MFARVISLFIRHLYKNPYGRSTYKYTNKVDFMFLRGLSKQSHMVVLLFVFSILYDRMEARLMGGNGELSIISPTVGPDLDIYSGLYSPLKNYGQYGFLTPELATNSLRNLVQGYTLPIKTLFTAEAEVFYTILILVLTADVDSIKDMQAVTDLDI
jgi:hypothetical protein